MSEPDAPAPAETPIAAPAGSSIGGAVGTAVAMLVLGFGILIVAPSAVRTPDASLRFALTQALKMVFGFALTHLVLVRLRKLAPERIGLRFDVASLGRLGVGSALGAGLVVASFCIAWGAGAFVVAGAPVETSPSGTAAALLAVGSLCGALFEELVFRVGLTGVLALALPPGLAIAAPAGIFGLVHALNPGATTVGVANTMLAGLLLGFLFYDPKAARTPSLGMATGFHFAWNFVLGTVLGVPVSGHLPIRSYLVSEPTDVRWSGGSYGLEGSIGVSAVLVIAVVLAARRARLPAPPVTTAAQ